MLVSKPALGAPVAEHWAIYQSLFEAAPVPMWVYDPKSLRFLMVNHAAVVELYGYTTAEFLRMTIKDIRPREEIERLVEFLKHDDRPKRTWGAWQHRKKDGSVIDVEVYGTHVEVDGRVLSAAIVNDVTERRKLQAEILAESDRFRVVMRQLPAFVWTTDRSLTYTFYEGSAAALGGFDIASMPGRSVLVLAQETVPVEAILKRYSAALSGREVSYDYVRDGRSFECTLQPLRDANAKIIGTVGIAVEVTERRRADEFARRREAIFATGERIARLGTWEYDFASETVVWSDELYEIMGHPVTDRSLTYESFWEHVHRDDVDKVAQSIAETGETGQGRRVEHRIVRRDGQVRWVECWLQPSMSDGRLVRLFGAALDITDRKLAEDRVAHLLMHDALTDLPNRVSAERFIDKAIADANGSGLLMAVLALDIDRFKTINDGLGHAVGDRLLQALPERLRACVRAEDGIARLGGDMFIVTLAGAASVLDIAEAANRILKRVSEPFQIIGEHQLTISVSIGISVYPTDGANADVLIECAEGAMFDAKEQGRGRVQFSSENQQALAVDRLTLEQDLRTALARNELVLHYQPMIDVATGKIGGAEALLRWDHPRRGRIPPDRFIPIAEETGLIVPIGAWVLHEACAQLMRWRDAGNHDLSVAVNVSELQIRQKDIVRSLADTLRDTGVDPGGVTLELTESGIMSDPNAAETLRELKALGVKLSIDDFGTGYSSLAYLKRFPIDVLKIDRTFVHDLTTDAYDDAIATTIVTLGHSLHMSVIAEGVETVEQWKRIRSLGCDGAQGFYFSRPVAPEEFAGLLQRVDTTVP